MTKTSELPLPAMQSSTPTGYINYYASTRDFPLTQAGLQQQVIDFLKPIEDEATLKITNEQRSDIIQQIFDALNFCKNPKFAQHICVKLADICNQDLRFEGLLCQSKQFPYIFDKIEEATTGSNEQKISFAFFLGSVCKRMEPEHEKFKKVRDTFFDYFNSLQVQLTNQNFTFNNDQQQTSLNDIIQNQATIINVVNRFLRNEYLFAQLFTPDDNLDYGKFYANKVKIMAGPVGKAISILQEQIKYYQPILLYPNLITLWLFSFHDGINELMLSSGLIGVILRAISLRAIQQNSKLIRVVCLILGNLKTNQRAISQIVASSGQRLIQQLTTLTWPADSAIEQTLNDVLKQIQQSVTDQSTIQKYKTELEQNVLELSPLHTNAAFWKSNAQQFTADGATLMKKLITIGENAKKNDDRTTLKVVLNDFSMFVQNHPQGRDWCERLPGMLKVSMSAMSIEDEDLQALAIQTTSRLLLNKVV